MSVRFHSTSFRGFSEEQGYPIDRGSRLNATEAEEGVEHNTPPPALHGRRRRRSPAQLALHVHFRVTDGGRTEGEADGRSLFSLFSAFLPSFLFLSHARSNYELVPLRATARAYFCALLLYYNFYYCTRRDLDEKIKKASIHYRESETRHSTALLQFYGNEMESER